MSTISGTTGYFSEALPIRLASKALQLQWRVVTIPWSTFLFWMSCCCSLLLRFLIIAGAPPGEFYNKTKVRDLNCVVEHLQQSQRDLRNTIKELQEKVDLQQRDRKRAIAKLNKLRQNGQQQGESSAAEESQIWTGMAAAKSGFPWSMHVSMALVTVAAFLFFEQRDSSALIRKLVWSIVIPAWILWAWTVLGDAPRACTALLHCTSWFLLGVLFLHWTKI
ncbi:g12744 [Coccomyxa viridis]|uniref:G12744 protein n=1 Tax=Coccomyxa viridis TaxID=1274662 RepID=A0ABP1GBE2_9CHLO